MNILHFQLVTPQRTVLSEELESLSCPTTEGQITILPEHTPLVATLQSGELIARTKNNDVAHFIHVSGGFVEVKADNFITVLADEAEHFYEIDEKQEEEARERAKEILEQTSPSDSAYAMAAANLERSLTRIRIVRKHAHRRQAITSDGIFKE